jgi:FkbH-like protein
MTATILAPEARAEARDVLAARASTLPQLLRAIGALEQEPAERTVRIGVSSSVTVDLLGVYLRRHGLLAGTHVEVVAGGYDDPIGDVERFVQDGVEHVLLLPFFVNLLPSFEAQLPNLDPAAVDALEGRLRGRYRLALEAARGVPTVHVGTLSRMGAPASAAGRDVVAEVLDRFDAALREEAAAFSNVRLLDTGDVVRTVGRPAAFDARFYYRSKAPWTGAFLDEFARRVAVDTRGFGAHFPKVLALDCDNTLWGGILGEDSVAGIRLGPHDHPGNVFWRVQQELAALRRRGVLLCLVTKNNPEDVDEVLRTHPDMVLRDDDFVVKRVNWDDKPSNLRALAAELDLGLDSVVFLDDSSFECEAVRAQLPMVRTVQVPSTLSEYPQVVAGIAELFPAGATADGADKTEQYRQRAQARQLEARSADHESYLASLQLTVELRRDQPEDAARVGELSQKSNQFNLTTRRYGVGEIEALMAGPDTAVWSVVVGDTFGSAGLTGAAVVRFDGAIAHVENFFLSCRVLGRGVETALWPALAADAAARGCTELRARFAPTAKNAQVADFYDRLGFRVVADEDDGSRTYAVATAEYPTPSPAWIEVTHVG